jgi:hypothetical protein
MYKVIINYGGITGQDDKHKAIEIILYHPEKSKDGTHITASSFFSAQMLKRLSKKQIDALINSLIPSFENCMKEIDKRKELENK